MLTLNGTLRQSGEVTIKERPLVKIWIEHTTPRENGTDDLKIEELFLEKDAAKNLPPKGSPIAVIVRAYPKGRDIGFAAVGVAPSPAAQKAA
jgi:hypothetical protein